MNDTYKITHAQSEVNSFLETATNSFASAAAEIGKPSRYGLDDKWTENVINPNQAETIINGFDRPIDTRTIEEQVKTIQAEREALDQILIPQESLPSNQIRTITDNVLEDFYDATNGWWSLAVQMTIGGEAKEVVNKIVGGELGKIVDDLAPLYNVDTEVKSYTDQVSLYTEKMVEYTAMYRYHQSKWMSHAESNELAMKQVTGKNHWADALEEFRSYNRIEGTSIEAYGKTLYDSRLTNKFEETISLQQKWAMVFQNWLKDNVFGSDDGRVIGNINLQVPLQDSSVLTKLSEGIQTSIVPTLFTLAHRRLSKNVGWFFKRKHPWLAGAATNSFEEVYEQAIANYQTLETGWYGLSAGLWFILWAQSAITSTQINGGPWVVNPNLKKLSPVDYLNVAVWYDRDGFNRDFVEDYSQARTIELESKSQLTKGESIELTFLQDTPSTDAKLEFYRRTPVMADLDAAINEYQMYAHEIAADVQTQTLSTPNDDLRFIQADINKTIAEIASVKFFQQHNMVSEWAAVETIGQLQDTLTRQQEWMSTNQDRPSMRYWDYLSEVHNVTMAQSDPQTALRMREQQYMDPTTLVQWLTQYRSKWSATTGFRDHINSNKAFYQESLGNIWVGDLESNFPIFDQNQFNEVVQRRWYEFVDEANMNVSGTQVTMEKYQVSHSDGVTHELWVLRYSQGWDNFYVVGQWTDSDTPYNLPETLIVTGNEWSTIEWTKLSYDNFRWTASYYIDANGSVLVNDALLQDQWDAVSEMEAAAVKWRITQEQQKKGNQKKSEELRQEVIKDIGQTQWSMLFRQMIMNADIFRNYIVDVYAQAQKEGLAVAQKIKKYIDVLVDKVTRFTASTKDVLFKKFSDIYTKFPDGKRVTQDFIKRTVDRLVQLVRDYPLHVGAWLAGAATWMLNQWVFLEFDITNGLMVMAAIAPLATNKNNSPVNNADAILATLLVNPIDDPTVPFDFYKKQQLIQIKKKVAAIQKYVSNRQTEKVSSNHIQKVYDSFIEGIENVLEVDPDRVSALQDSLQAMYKEMDMKLTEIELMSMLTEDYPKILNILEVSKTSLSKRVVESEWENLRTLLETIDPLPFAKWYLSNPAMTIQLLNDWVSDVSFIMDQLRVELMYGYISGDQVSLANYFTIATATQQVNLANVVSNDIDSLLEGYVFNMYKEFESKKIFETLGKKDRVIANLQFERKEFGLKNIKKNPRWGRLLEEKPKSAIITIGKARTGKSTWAKKQKWFSILSINDYADGLWNAQAMKLFENDIASITDNNIILDYSFTNPAKRKAIINTLQRKWYDVYAVMFDRPEAERAADAQAAGVDVQHIESEQTVTPEMIAEYDIQILDKDLKWFDISILWLAEGITIDNAITDEYVIENKTIELSSWRKFSYPWDITINTLQVNVGTDIYRVPELTAALLVKINPWLLEDYYTINDGLQAYIDNKDLADVKEYDPAIVIDRAFEYGLLQEDASTIGDVLNQVNLAAMMLPSYQTQSFDLFLLQNRLADLFGIANNNETVNKSAAIIRSNILSNTITEATVKWISLLWRSFEWYENFMELMSELKWMGGIPLTAVLSSVSTFDPDIMDMKLNQIFIFDESQVTSNDIDIRTESNVNVSPAAGNIFIKTEVIEDGESQVRYVNAVTKEMVSIIDGEWSQIHVFDKWISVQWDSVIPYTMRSNRALLKQTAIGLELVVPKNIAMKWDSALKLLADLKEDMQIQTQSEIIKQSKSLIQKIWNVWLSGMTAEVWAKLSNEINQIVLDIYESASNVMETSTDLIAQERLLDWINESADVLWLPRFNDEQWRTIIKGIQQGTIGAATVRAMFLAENVLDTDAAYQLLYKKAVWLDPMLDPDSYRVQRSPKNLSLKIMQYFALRWATNISWKMKLIADALASAISNSHIFGNMYEQFLEYDSEWGFLAMQDFLDSNVSVYAEWLEASSQENFDSLSLWNNTIGAVLSTVDSWLSRKTDPWMSAFQNTKSYFAKTNVWGQYHNMIMADFIGEGWARFENLTTNRSILLLADIHSFVWNTSSGPKPLSKVSNVVINNSVRKLMGLESISESKAVSIENIIMDKMKSELNLLYKLSKKINAAKDSWTAKEIEWFLFDLSYTINGMLHRITWKKFEGVVKVSDMRNFKEAKFLVWEEDAVTKIQQSVKQYLQWFESKVEGKEKILYDKITGNIIADVKVWDPLSTGEFFFTDAEKTVLGNEFLSYYNQNIPYSTLQDIKEMRALLLQDRISQLVAEWFTDEELSSLFIKRDAIVNDIVNAMNDQRLELREEFVEVVNEAKRRNDDSTWKTEAAFAIIDQAQQLQRRANELKNMDQWSPLYKRYADNNIALVEDVINNKVPEDVITDIQNTSNQNLSDITTHC
jgi:hypothetical protein